jgi:hypothetical protein
MILTGEEPTSTQMAWTLARKGEHVTCTLISARPGEYLLRLTCNGHPLIDARCDELQQALARSLEAFGDLQAHGWVCAEA